jgi:hypothetical protein
MNLQAGPPVSPPGRARGHDDEGAMMGNDEASRFRELLAAERRSADLYDGLAEAAHGERREILNQLAAVERRHAEHWAAKLVVLGEPVPEPGSRGSRTRVLSWLARRLSIDAVLPYLERAERADAGMYQDDPEATSDMAVSERSHARVLTQLRGGDRDHRDVLRRSEHGTVATDPAPFGPVCSASTTGSCRIHRW